MAEPTIAGWNQGTVDNVFGTGTFDRWNAAGAKATTAAPTQAETPKPAFDMAGYRALSAYLTNLGLGNLFTTAADGTPGGWLYKQMQAGMDTQAEIAPIVEATPEWQARFKVIVEQRKQSAAGKPVQVMTPGEVIQYEDTARNLYLHVGLPTSMQMDRDAIDQLMINGVSPSELQQRLGQAFSTVHDTPPAIRAAFESFYGVGAGDANLAAYFLNPGHQLANLDTQARSAFAAGTASRYGFGLDQARAERIGVGQASLGGIDNTLGQIAQQADVFNAGIAESGTNLNASTTGVDAAMFGSADASRQIEQRIAARRANSASGAGGALLTNRGLTGTGISGQGI